MAKNNKLLNITNLTVTFEGFKALSDLNLQVQEGELRCIIGPNGAGKSTLLDVITGRTRPSDGKITLKDTYEVTSLREQEISRLGIGRKFQRPSIFPNHTVTENLKLALFSKLSLLNSLVAVLSKEDQQQIEEILTVTGLMEQKDKRASILSHGEKQWLSIGMLLIQSPELLLLDEPVAGMTSTEIDKTTHLLNSLKDSHTIIVIEHDMEFIRSIGEIITVLHQGSLLCEGPLDEVSNNHDVQEVYLSAC